MYDTKNIPPGIEYVAFSSKVPRKCSQAQIDFAALFFQS